MNIRTHKLKTDFASQSIVLMIVLVAMSSCSEYYFDRPQPMGEQNVYAFPSAYQGIWTDGRDSLVVSEQYFANIEYKNMATPYRATDTTRYAIFVGDKVYPYDSLSQRIMDVGYPYEIKNDSLFYTTRQVIEIQLGRKAVLRAVDDRFILNVKNDNQWWELFLIETTPENKILVRYLGDDELKMLGIRPIFETADDSFFNVQWTVKDLNALIDKNLFADTLFYLDQQNRY